MDMDDEPIFSGNVRPSHDAALEESGILGTRRRCTNINRFEIIFLVVGILAAIATDGLTIFRFTKTAKTSDPDFVYGIVILVNSLFLLLFLITGIFQQRITDIVTFFISSVMLTIYVIAHYIIREKEGDPSDNTDKKIRLARLISTGVFNVIFIPLTIIVIQDYRRDEFSIRLFGAFPTARLPLKIYNIFDCVARINTMLSISIFLLNLYDFNDFEDYDKVLLAIGIPVSFLWLGIGIGMIRLENRILVGAFYLFSLFQPAFIAYCLYSIVDHSSSKITTITTTLTSTTTSLTSTTTFLTSTTTFLTSTTTFLTSTTTSLTSTTPSPNIVSIRGALYVCIGINLLTHVLSMILALLCVRNFGKGLKERIFNNTADKWLQKRWSRS